MDAYIELKLFATLAKFLPPEGGRYPVSPGMTVDDIIEALDIPRKEVKLVFVNGVKKSSDTELKGGERIGIFPPVGGG